MVIHVWLKLLLRMWSVLLLLLCHALYKIGRECWHTSLVGGDMDNKSFENNLRKFTNVKFNVNSNFFLISTYFRTVEPVLITQSGYIRVQQNQTGFFFELNYLFHRQNFNQIQLIDANLIR